MNLSPLQKFVHDTLRTYSLGAYRAVVSGLSSASQVLVDPDWLGAPVRARTVESPILDIRPKRGTPMAVVCQDAAPSFPLALGQLKEEGASEAMTAWVRADLDEEPDVIRVGAETLTELGTGEGSGVATKALLARASVTSAIAALDDDILGIPATSAGGANLVETIDVLSSIRSILEALVDDASFSSSVTASD